MKLKINHIKKTRTPHFTPNIEIDCTITINLESLMDNSLIGSDLYAGK